LSITLGDTVPTLGSELFIFVSAPGKTVTVKVPDISEWNGIVGTYSGADNTENWGNGFRGLGWDGSALVASWGRNSNITLHVVLLP